MKKETTPFEFGRGKKFSEVLDEHKLQQQKKIDMYYELVELVEIMNRDYNGLSAQGRLNEDGMKLHKKIKDLLKQAERK